MKASVSLAVALVAFGATAVAVHAATTKMPAYHASFAASMAACTSTLGSVHFDNGQAIVLASPGVNEGLNTGSEDGAQGVTFVNQRTHARAAFDVFPKRHTLNAKHVRLLFHARLACVLPD